MNEHQSTTELSQSMEPNANVAKSRLHTIALAMLAEIGRIPFLLYGILIATFGVSLYIFGVLLSLPRILLNLNAILLEFNEWIVWYSGAPVLFGLLVGSIDLFLLISYKRRWRRPVMPPIENTRLTVALTAYNDEESIGRAVEDFQRHPLVRRVIVVSNNSQDKTVERACEAGAIVFNELLPGYGRCVYRCLQESCRFDDTELVLLCEGDGTFRTYDIDKFMAYLTHASIVAGTRIVEQLRDYNTQLSTFMFYGNLFVAKLLEAKHIGKGTFTDVGTTYKLCRKDALLRLLPKLDPAINLSFNAHFLDTALANNELLLECPITFAKRIGVSKGGNLNNRRALKVGLQMIRGIVLGWPKNHATTN